MTEARVAPAAPKKLPIIRGSTRDILIGLYANLMGIAPPTEKNITLERAIKFIDQPVAAKRNALFTVMNRLMNTSDSLDKSVERLTAQDKKLVEDNQYAAIAKELKQRVIALNQKEDELKAEYEKLVEEQTKAVREQLLASMENERIDPQKMVNLEIKQKNFSKAVTDYLEDHRKTQQKLDDLYKEVYSRIKEEKNKRDLPPPELNRRAAPAA